jgi:transcriptional regulator GlxA family with amidase domain
MADFALLALDGAYRSSVGALTDSYLLARDRIEHVFAGADHVRMETGLRLYSADGGSVTLSDGSQLKVDGAPDSGAEHAFIWIPAFRAGGAQALKARLSQSRDILAWLGEQARRGAIIGASGSASMLLMAAGLTGGMAVPVARALQPLTRAFFPRQRFEERLGIVDNGSLLIANGIANDLSLIVRVMERTLSPDIARWLTSIIGLDSQNEDLLAPDPMVARAQLWIEQRFTGPMTMAELAGELSTSPATLNRRFRKALGLSPKAYVQQLRLQAAIRMLERSSRSIDRVADLVGFSDSRLFRAMFRQQTGMTATQWRTRARARKAQAAERGKRG